MSLRLLGGFALCKQGAVHDRLPKKAQGLLAYLAMHIGVPIARDRLATLLWADSGQEQARRSLRQCLMSIRAIDLPPPTQVMSRFDGLLLSGDCLTVDVLEFQSASQSNEIEQLEAAAHFYKGEFLTGLQIRSEPFNEWLSIEHRRLSFMISDVLFRLATAYERAQDTARAMSAAQRLTALDPLREDGHRLLMQLLVKAGRRSAALEQHAICTDALRRELGVAPEQATLNLAEAIGRGASLVPVGGSLPIVDAPAHLTNRNPTAIQEVPKPSIAVLPFTNLSGEPDQDYFADGMVEDITIALGRVPWLLVSASSSALAYRGCAIDIRRVGSELGVRYVLRGSVRKTQKRMRIVVQLNDTKHGSHVWADRFEGELSDVFAIQDRVTTQVCATLAPAMQWIEIERSRHKPTENLTAYDLYLRALPRFRTTYADNEEALRLLYQAIELDPSYACAYAFAARCYQFQRLFGWVVPPDPRFAEGVRLARRAADLGPNDSEALWMSGIALAQLGGELDYGLTLIERSLSLNPNSASAWISSAFVRSERGEADAALEDFKRAQRLNPLDSMHHVQWAAAARAFLTADRLEEAADAVGRALKERPTYVPALRLRVVIYGSLRRSVEARQAVDDLLSANPDASVSTIRAYWEATLGRNPSLLARFVEGARLAGLPETSCRSAWGQTR